MIRVSPSLLESYRLFTCEDWFTVEKIEEAITRKFTPTPQVLLGSAYHGMLEHQTTTHETYFAAGNPGEGEMLATENGYTFAYEPCIEPVSDFLRAGCVHEVRAATTLQSRFGEVSIATMADAVHGNIGGEWKTTEKSIQLAKYMDSVQWKLCCHVLGLKAMDYRIVQLIQREDNVWTVKNWDGVQLLFSPSHMDEVMSLIDGLIGLCQDQGWMDYLVPHYGRAA